VHRAADLNLTLTKIEEKPRPEIIALDTEQIQNVKWIRIKLSD
jgi:hypothetical protein